MIPGDPASAPATTTGTPSMIRTATLMMILFCVTGLGAVEAAAGPFTMPITFTEIQDASAVIGKWSFPASWSGYMGMAIEFTPDGYRYWFQSDARGPDEPTYPLVGTWRLVNGVVILNPPEAGHLYADTWMLATANGATGLLAPDNLKVLVWQKAQPESRMLTKLPDTTPVWPLLNMPRTP
jgi:hypothetical protein